MKLSHLVYNPANDRRPWWRNERGIGIIEVTILVTLITAAAMAHYANQRNPEKNPIFGGAKDQATLSNCLANVGKREQSLKDQFPPNTQIPLDNADLQFILNCKKEVSRILEENAKAAQNSQYQDLLDTLKTPIDNLGTCSFNVTFPKTKPAGALESVGLGAEIPLETTDVVGNVTASTGETDTLTRDTKFKFSGNIFLDGSKITDTKTVTLTLTPSGSTAVSCPPATFTWTKPEPPTIEAFAVQSAVKKGKTFIIAWIVKKAESVSISGIGEDLPLSGQRSLSIDQDTTFTLTAKRGALPATQSKTVKVQESEFFIQFGSSQDNQDVTEDSVLVGGTVTPTPPDRTTVTIGVNGEPVLSVPTRNGVFTARVALKNKVTLFDLRLSSTGLFVSRCGPTSTPIVIDNTRARASLGNVITAGIAAPGGGVDSNIATQVVYHAAKVTGGSLFWTGSCPGPSETLSSGYVLSGGSSREIGQVPCGSPCGVRTDCTAESHVQVETTVGPLFADATWRIDILP